MSEDHDSRDASHREQAPARPAKEHPQHQDTDKSGANNASFHVYLHAVYTAVTEAWVRSERPQANRQSPAQAPVAVNDLVGKWPDRLAAPFNGQHDRGHRNQLADHLTNLVYIRPTQVRQNPCFWQLNIDPVAQIRDIGLPETDEP